MPLRLSSFLNCKRKKVYEKGLGTKRQLKFNYSHNHRNLQLLFVLRPHQQCREFTFGSVLRKQSYHCSGNYMDCQLCLIPNILYSHTAYCTIAPVQKCTTLKITCFRQFNKILIKARFCQKSILYSTSECLFPSPPYPKIPYLSSHPTFPSPLQ